LDVDIEGECMNGPVRYRELNRDELSVKQKAVFDSIASTRGVVPTPFHILAESPQLASLTQALGAFCRYGDCSHTREPGCAVLDAVAAGRIDTAHYDSYIKLRGESAFHQMSDAEKRKKDRDFGRFIKSAKKDLDDA